MIVRRRTDDLLLVTQEDHAHLAGRLADLWGNGRFASPKPRDLFVTAVEHHDAGWSLHDSQPTLNPKHYPADFFEMPIASYVRMWVASVAAAAARSGPMGGLLVSLHFCRLAEQIPLNDEPEAVQLLVQDFVRCQKHRQADYRSTLGLTLSGNNGRLYPHSDKDRELLYHFDVLRAVDWMSLILCARELPEFMHNWHGRWMPDHHAPEQGAPAGSHGSNGSVACRWEDECTLRWSPWPLSQQEFIHVLPVRRIPNGVYRKDQDLQRVYEGAPDEHLTVTLLPLED